MKKKTRPPSPFISHLDACKHQQCKCTADYQLSYTLSEYRECTQYVKDSPKRLIFGSEKRAIAGKEINMHPATYAYFTLAKVRHDG